MDELDYRVKKANEFYKSLKSKGYLDDSSIDLVIKGTCANIARYEVSNELFDSTLDFLNENLKELMKEYLSKIVETVESASKTLEFVVDENPQGINVLSFSSLTKLAYDEVKEELTRSRKIITLDLHKEE